MANSFRLNDYGLAITLTVVNRNQVFRPIDAATTKEFIFYPPEGAASITKTAVFVTDGTDGKLTYTLLAGDLNIAGHWRVQAKVTEPTAVYRSAPLEFSVEAI